jgi:hypothetical protein
MSTLATLAFIGAVAATGAYLAQLETVVDGRVMAADLKARLTNDNIATIECDREIPIRPAGAVFTCAVRATDGSTASIEYTMDRAGSLAARLLDATGATRPRVRRSDDPWGD